MAILRCFLSNLAQVQTAAMKRGIDLEPRADPFMPTTGKTQFTCFRQGRLLIQSLLGLSAALMAKCMTYQL